MQNCFVNWIAVSYHGSIKIKLVLKVFKGLCLIIQWGWGGGVSTKKAICSCTIYFSSHMAFVLTQISLYNCQHSHCSCGRAKLLFLHLPNLWQSCQLNLESSIAITNNSSRSMGESSCIFRSLGDVSVLAVGKVLLKKYSFSKKS